MRAALIGLLVTQEAASARWVKYELSASAANANANRAKRPWLIFIERIVLPAFQSGSMSNQGMTSCVDDCELRHKSMTKFVPVDKNSL